MQATSSPRECTCSIFPWILFTLWRPVRPTRGWIWPLPLSLILFDPHFIYMYIFLLYTVRFPLGACSCADHELGARDAHVLNSHTLDATTLRGTQALVFRGYVCIKEKRGMEGKGIIRTTCARVHLSRAFSTTSFFHSYKFFFFLQIVILIIFF